MNQFLSALVNSGKHTSSIYKIFAPRFNKEFFKRASANIEILDASIQRRSGDGDYCSQADLKSFAEESRTYIKLKDRLDKLEKKNDEAQKDEAESIRDQIQDLEDKLLPIAVTLPNRWSKNVPSEDVTIEELSSDRLKKANLTKVLSHIKLSYINNCYSKSVIGPNSHYYYGIGAKLQYGLSDFFTTELEQHDFLLFSGLCLTKSAVIEATNSRASKDYLTDPCHVLSEEPKQTSLHLVEASRESLLGFLTTIGHRASNEPLRLLSCGAGYRIGKEWFDPDDRKVTQVQTVHTLTMTPSIEQYSMKEYLANRDLLWDIYKKLELPTRLVQCSVENMYSNEYDAHRIDIWLPSRQQWIQVSRISHYLDHITIRAGLKRGHIIDSMVYDGQALVAAIIENNQTSTGKFIIPSVIGKHISHLSETERLNYICETASESYQDLSRKQPLSNHEQRRYFRPPGPRSGVFSHSYKAYKEDRARNRQSIYVLIGMVIFFCCQIDWEEVKVRYIPTWLHRFWYNNVFRPVRRVWWYLTYTDPAKKPADLPFDEIEHLTIDEIRARDRESFYIEFERRPVKKNDGS